MKKLFLNCFILAVLSACTDESLSSMELVDPASEPVPECSINPLFGDWDDFDLQKGQSRSFRIDGNFSSVQWTSSNNGVISIASGATANTVTVKALASGSANLSVTGNVSNGSGTCGRTGTINVPQCTSNINPGCLTIAKEGCSSAFANISNGCRSDISSVVWTYSYDNSNFTSISNNSSPFWVLLNTPSQGYPGLTFKAVVNYNNGCPSKTIQKTVDGCSGGGGPGGGIG